MSARQADGGRTTIVMLDTRASEKRLPWHRVFRCSPDASVSLHAQHRAGNIPNVIDNGVHVPMGRQVSHWRLLHAGA